MKILVTGGLGHIGSRLIREIPKSFPGCQILIIDNLMTQRYCSLFNLPKGCKYTFVEGDLTSFDIVPYISDFDVVIHLAAITDAANSFSKAEFVKNNNFISTQSIARACAVTGVRLITISSTSVYGTQRNIVDEDCDGEHLRPQSPYAEVKLNEEMMVRKLVNESGLRATILRFGTIYGVSPGMRFHTAVNKFCWQAKFGLPITIWRTAFMQRRPYLDLGDACNAISHIIINDLFSGQLYNVLTENLTVKELIGAIKLRVPDLETEFVDTKIMNQLSYEVSATKLKLTGFSYTGNIQTGIDETLAVLG